MDTSKAGDNNVCRFMVTHGNSWIEEENIMTSNNLLLSSYLTSQENIREVIKVEEMSPTTGDDSCFSGATEDTKDVYTSGGEEYSTYQSDIHNTHFPSKTHSMVHERLQQTGKPYKRQQCG